MTKPYETDEIEIESTRIDVLVYGHKTEGRGRLETNETTGQSYFQTDKWDKSFSSKSEAKKWIEAKGFQFNGWDKYYI